MKEIPLKKQAGLLFSEIWKPTEDWKLHTNADIVTFNAFDNPKPYIKKRLKLQNTLYSDLTKTQDGLYDGIKSKTYKYDIRKSLKDDIKITLYSPDNLKSNEQIIRDFIACHHKMYKEKGMDILLKDIEIFPYLYADALWISVAETAEEPLVYHTYVDCGDAVRLLHSCSCFREKKELATLIGRANKRLHWDDLLAFKNLGYRTYDWGGVASFDNPNGIDLFKMSFGGEAHSYYKGQVGITTKGAIMLRLYRIIKP